MNISKKQVVQAFALAAGTSLAIAACGGGDDSGGGEGGSIAVGSKEFTEQLILGNIAAIALEDAGLDVDSDGIGIEGTENVRAGLESGDIDMYWEYTGTGYTTILGHDAADAPRDPQELYNTVKDEDAGNDIVWLEPSAANNGYAIGAPGDTASELGVTTLSDYAELVNSSPDDASLCAAAEFLDRADGLLGLQDVYGFELPASSIKEMDLDIVFTQMVEGGECNFGELFETDGRIPVNDITVLEDDKSAFVKYNITPTIRQDALDANPDVEDVLNEISAKLTTEKMLELNVQVDDQNADPADVAEQFLKDEGLIGG